MFSFCDWHYILKFLTHVHENVSICIDEVVCFIDAVNNMIQNYQNVREDNAWQEIRYSRCFQWTDFISGFSSAHHSPLSTRSHVRPRLRCHMFSSGMEEAATGQVHIKDVDPTTFKQVLIFLYTVLVKPPSVN